MNLWMTCFSVVSAKKHIIITGWKAIISNYSDLDEKHLNENYQFINGATITHKIFEINSTFHVKQRTTGKV